MNKKTEQEALATLAALCANGEHCTQEMLDKMQRWELSADAQARVMQYLTEHQYVDDERFTRAFALDKIRYNHWGRRKVEQALWGKCIPREIQTSILDEISEDEYLEVLRPLLKSKRRTVKARNAYEENVKLVRFALGRGFSMDLIRQCLDGADELNVDEDD